MEKMQKKVNGQTLAQFIFESASSTIGKGSPLSAQKKEELIVDSEKLAQMYYDVEEEFERLRNQDENTL